MSLRTSRLFGLASIAIASSGAAQSGVDTLDVLHELQSRQRELERDHRALLPRTASPFHGCPVRIGASCYWFNDSPAPPEPLGLAELRANYLALLDSVRGPLTSHPWVVGQRIRYLVDAADFDSAVDAAHACRPDDRWWCAALLGYTHHIRGDYVAAEQAFDSSLALMDDGRRCEWTDLTPLLTGRVRGQYRAAECAERDDLQAWLLWLSDPLYATPGNELRTEHLARHVYSTLLSESAGVGGARWISDDHRGTLRYGRPEWWERERPDARTTGADRVVTHHHPHGQYFLPLETEHGSVLDIRSDSWRLARREPPARHVAGPGYRWLDELVHEVSVFPRLDSATIVAEIAPQDDRLPADRPLELTLHAASGPRGPGFLRRAEAIGAAAVTVTVPYGDYVLSLEIVDDARTAAGRVRFGTRVASPPEDLLASSFLLFPGRDSLPRNRAEALARVNPARRYAPGERIDLYWEISSPNDVPQIIVANLELVRVNRSVLRRALEATPFASASRPINLEWTDLTRPRQGVYARALAVTLPDEIDRGVYAFTLTLRSEAGSVVRSRRDVVVERE